MMEMLQKKLQKELTPGSHVVSHVFSFPYWQPVAVEGNLFIYRIGEGNMKVNTPESPPPPPLKN